MKGVSIKCPECAARVSVEGDQDTATCNYCGTQCQVRRRSKVLQLPMPAPRPVAGVHVATARRNTGAWVISGIVLVAMVVPIWAATRQCAKATGIVEGDWSWDGVDSVMLVDVNGDHELDAIGRVRKLRPDDTMAVAAFDGTNGKRLWKSDKLGLRSDILHTVSGFVPGTAMFGAGVGELVGINAADGSVRWRIRLSEKIERLCAGDRNGVVVAETADKRRQVIAVADGRVEGPASGERCAALASDAAGADGPDREIWAWHNQHAKEVPREIEGMRIDGAVHHPASGVTAAVGSKQPGTSVPMVARIHPDGKTAVWSAMVPANDPLSAPTGSDDTDNTAADGSGIAVAYNVKFAHFYRVTLFAADDGRRRWDVEVPGEMPMSAVRMSPTHVFVSTWQGLFAFDRATGKLAFAIE
jgi:DNA-directed RNA polymerase subunit RPC12/RpoP